ncbi:MAG: aldehyde dehydrogenase [Flavobacteriaceae bacterium]
MESIPLPTLKELHAKQKEFYQELKNKPLAFRIERLKKLKQQLSKREPEILEALYSDLGKSDFEGYTSEILMVHKELDLFIKNLKYWAAPKRVAGSLLNFPSQDFILSESYGSVLMISPWNYPFQLSMIPLIGAVAAGNTVVLKPSEFAPNSSKMLIELLEAVFETDWVKVIEGDALIAQDLLKLQWDYIFFTGSTAVGKIVAQAAAVHLTPVTLELGGKSPCIVDGSTSIEKTARRIVFGKFLNCGQTCIAPDYVLVKKEYQEKLIKALGNEIEKAYGKDSSQSKDYGRIINEKHFDKLCNDLENQPVVFGGMHNKASLFFEPTLVLNPSRTSRLMTEEVFGPILPVLSYESQEELHEILGELKNPLAFYVFSKHKKFVQQLVLRYPFGGAVVNDAIVHFTNPKLPFGGVGESGMGAYHGKHSFDLLTHKKPIVKRSFWFDLPQRYAPYPKSLSTLKWILKKI